MNNLNKKILLLSLIIISFLNSVSLTVYENSADITNVPFDLEFHYPGNHNSGVVGYYDLSLGKGESQDLSITIINNQNTQMLIDILPTDGYTHPSGGLYYDKNPDTDMVKITDNRFMWSDNISVQKQAIILPNSSLNVPFKITVPQIDEGEVIAALNFSTNVKPSEESKSQEKSNVASFSFNVRKSVTIPIKVNIKKPVNLPIPSINFGDVEFEPGTCRVFYSLENILPIINNGINGDYEILDINRVSLFKGIFDLSKMAPKTLVKIPIPWNADTVQSGDYIFKININADNTKYSFEKPFKITDNDINIYSNTARVQSVIKNNSALYLIILLTFIVLCIIAVLLYYNLKKKNKT